jgi:hypothetical protein
MRPTTRSYTSAMVTAWVRVDAFDALPGVCVKTGEATAIRMRMPAEYVPVGFRWLMVFNVWGFLFARAAAARRRHVRVPISERAFRRSRHWQVSCVAVFVPSLVAGFVASLTVHPVVELLGYGLAVAAFVTGSWAYHELWVGLLVDRRGREVTVTRCHPAFARAAGQVAAASSPSAVRLSRREASR